MPRTGVAFACALLLATGCSRDAGANGDGGPPPAAPRGPEPPLSFDPANLRRGAEVGALRVDSTDVVWSEELGEWVGSVRFTGEVRLRGTAVPNFADPEQRGTCFEADSASGRRLPRWPGDARRPWFCFEDGRAAAELLGGPDSTRRRTIVIDRFTTVRAYTDAVNSARLVSAD